MSSEAPEMEVRAREMGWKPLEEFRGDPEKWVEADEYVRRGEQVLPFIKGENRRLQDKTDKLSLEIQRLTAVVAEQRQSMDALAEFSQTQLKEKLAEQRRQLTAELRVANREEDDARAQQLEEALEQNAEARDKLAKPVAAPPPQQTEQPAVPESPEYQAWLSKNSWFGGQSETDAAKTAAAQRFGIEAASAGKRGQAFFDAVDEKMAKAFPAPRRADPTEDGRPSGGQGGASSGDKGFKSLPAEAQAKAREQASRFVGANKMFKTEADWFSYYSKQYNAEAA